MNPDSEIKKFQQIVKDRKYDFFSDESIKDWRERFAQVSNGDIDRDALPTLCFL